MTSEGNVPSLGILCFFQGQVCVPGAEVRREKIGS